MKLLLQLPQPVVDVAWRRLNNVLQHMTGNFSWNLVLQRLLVTLHMYAY